MIPGLNSYLYELTGIVSYKALGKEKGHYTAFFCSSKDSKRWFYANDAEVNSFTAHVYSVILLCATYRSFQSVLLQFSSKNHFWHFTN